MTLDNILCDAQTARMAHDMIGSAEACQVLGGIDRSTLSRWVQLKKLQPVLRLPGARGAMLFRRADVERLARERAA